MIGYAFCGSFCTHEASLSVLAELLTRGYPVTPIFSETAYHMDTKFGRAADITQKVEAISSTLFLLQNGLVLLRL